LVSSTENVAKSAAVAKVAEHPMKPERARARNRGSGILRILAIPFFGDRHVSTGTALWETTVTLVVGWEREAELVLALLRALHGGWLPEPQFTYALRHLEP